MSDNKKIKFILPEHCEELLQEIPNNIDRYLNGDFSDILGSRIPLSETDINFDYSKIKKINITKRTKRKSDGLNAFRVYCSIPDLPKNYATYNGIWVKMCHDECLNYVRGRWLENKKEEELEGHIKTHFFGQGRTGYRDDNAIGRLWWTGSIIANLQQERHDTLIDFCKSVCSVFKFAQIRSSTVERPRIFNQKHLAKEIIEYIKAGNLPGEKDTRSFMKNVNRNASGLVMGALNKNDFDDFFSNCID